MDAKNKIDFINSIVSGNEIFCSVCKASNKAENKHCFSCGTEFSLKEKSPADKNLKESILLENVEQEAKFAKGLPSWDIVPPQIMVRRR